MRTLLPALLLVFLPFQTASAQTLPRTEQGTPDLQGIWQAQSRAHFDLEAHPARHDMPAGESAVVGGSIPYQDWALAQKQQNFDNRATADPFSKCYLPGVPRMMTLDQPFQIFQTQDHVAITFEWSQVYRLIYSNGQEAKYPGIESWMGNSRGRWEGDTLVVEVNDFNNRSWLDGAGNFHSDALRVTERYRMLDPDTIEYEATLQDEAVFTRPWTIRLNFYRQKEMTRLLEFQCQAEKEEANGDFERDANTWYPAAAPADTTSFQTTPFTQPPLPEPTGEIARLADGAPNISGYHMSDAGGANYGLEKRENLAMFPPTRGVVIDPVDGVLPYQAWAREEFLDRRNPYRGYDDPTAHCFVAGIPRSHYVPAPFFILQPPGYVVILYERMSYRVIPLDDRDFLPDAIRLWMGDAVGRWEGDSLVVESRNYNGKAWLNELGDVVTYGQRVVESFTPTGQGRIIYRATVSDPMAYTRPWTIEMPFNRQDEELLEVACLEDNNDLQHLKDVRDEHRALMRQED